MVLCTIHGWKNMFCCSRQYFLKLCSRFYDRPIIIVIFLLLTTTLSFYLSIHQNLWSTLSPLFLDQNGPPLPSKEFSLTYWNPALLNSGINSSNTYQLLVLEDQKLKNVSIITQKDNGGGDDDERSTIFLRNLSNQFQNEFSAIQTPTSCHPIQTAIACTISNSYCGFGCFLHYEIGCLMLAYSLKLPLIFKDQSEMIFGEKLDNYLEPLKVNCSGDHDHDLSMRHVIRADWRPSGFSLTQKSPKRVFSILKKGLQVPKEFAQLVEHHHKNPYLWFVSQFMKIIFKIRPATAQKIEQFKKQLFATSKNGRSNDSLLIGLHVRRTDKYKETRVNLSTFDFMKAVQNYLEKIEFDGGEKKPILIFVASEDCNVISEFQERHAGPHWTFVGGRCEETLDSPGRRRGHVFEIIRDISVLADCDHVICTHSSNVCRAVVEIRNFRQGHLNPEIGVTSLDGAYNFMLYNYGYKFKDGLVPI